MVQMYGVFCWRTATLWEFGAFAVFVSEAWVSTEPKLPENNFPPLRVTTLVFCLKQYPLKNRACFVFPSKSFFRMYMKKGWNQRFIVFFLCKNHRFAVSDSPKSTSFAAEENASTGGQLALSWTGVMGGSWVPGCEGERCGNYIVYI